jgi:hypothetical protein
VNEPAALDATAHTGSKRFNPASALSFPQL